MDEPILYNYILVKTDGSKYIGWSKATKKPKDVTGLKWYPWSKELPENIDTEGYRYNKGELVKG